MNKTCDCLPFYGGEFCEKYTGIPAGMDKEMAETVMEYNHFGKQDYSSEVAAN